MHITSASPVPAAGDDPQRLLREDEAALLLGYSTRALQNWRIRGGGPLFVKVSARSIRYRRADLIAWADERIRASTSDTGSAGRE
jgi:predicted DNA-binding transcriptional regulator AlpA